MLAKDFLYPPFSSAEKYFRNIRINSPDTYTNPLYSFFGHLFISATDSDSINDDFEKTNKLYTNPLLEDTFKNLNAIENCSVVFSRHQRYIPSRFHCHGYFEMIYQHSGFSLHNINGTEIRTSPGELIIVPPYVYHSIISPCDDGLTINIGVKLSDFSEKYDYITRDNSTLSAFFKGCLNVKRDFEYIIFDISHNPVIEGDILHGLFVQETGIPEESSKTSIYLQSAVHQVFANLLQCSEKSILVPYKNKNTDTLIKILLYIIKNYKTVDLGLLSREFHFTEPYLSRIIKTGTGHTFSELLCNIRLNSSLLFLEKTKLPVAEIAVMVGYKAPENYMRNFKAAYKITPTEYRKYKVG